MTKIGAPVPREEDLRLLQGCGRYLDAVRTLDEARAVVFRSPVAHADIVSLNVDAARAAPGVLAALTGDDSVLDGLRAQWGLVQRHLSRLDPTWPDLAAT